MKTAIFSQVRTLVRTDGYTKTLQAYQTEYLDDGFSFVDFLSEGYQDGHYDKKNSFTKNVFEAIISDVRLLIFKPLPERSHSHAEFFKKNFTAGYKRFEICNYLDGAYKLNVFNESCSKNIELPFKAPKTEIFFKNGLLAILLSGVRKIFFIFDPINLEIKFERVCDSVSVDGDEITVTINHFTAQRHLEKITLLTADNLKTVKRSLVKQKNRAHPYLIGVNFLEEVMIKGDILEYLDGEVAENASEIFDFFGNFSAIIYLNNLGFTNCLGLLYPDCVKVFSPVIREGKITDFSLK